jgi:hypothetical protein
VDKDLQRAIDVLKKGKYKLVAVKGEEVIYCGQGRGITPLLELYEKRDQRVVGGSVADNVIGNAAALLYLDLGVARVYGQLLSSSARDLLQGAGVWVTGGKIVPNILSLDKQGLCPMEKIARECRGGEEFQKKAKQFLAGMERPVSR